MTLLIGIIIGVGLAILAYWFYLKPAADQQQTEMRRLRKALDEKERVFESRLKDTVQSLQRDHQSQLESQTTRLKQQYEGQIQALEAQLAAASKSAEPPIEASMVGEVPSTSTAVAKVDATPAEAVLSPAAPELSADPLPAPPATIATIQNASLAAPPLSTKMAVTGALGVGVADLPGLIRSLWGASTEERQETIATLGDVLSVYGKRIESQAAIATLGKLSRDADPQVRLKAIEALGRVASDKVIPLLKLALRDPDPAVVQAASGAITWYKGFPVRSKPAKAAPKPRNR